MSRFNSAAIAIAGLLFCSVASAQVQRSFVASYGNDANVATNCPFANPCRGFQAAHGVTNANGEIVALDAAGYGAVTITKSISIIANPGFYAGISASTGAAVTIATASVNVRLSGLKINGIGATTGVSMTNGASLTIDGCTVSGFANNGIEVTTGARVSVVDSLLMSNGNAGLYLKGNAKAEVFNSKFFRNFAGVFVDETATAGTTTQAAVTNSVSAHNTYGFANQAGVASTTKLSISNSSADDNTSAGVVNNAFGGGTSILVISSSKFTHNGIGVQDFSGASTNRSAGNNLINDNGTNVSGTLTNVGTL